MLPNNYAVVIQQSYYCYNHTDVIQQLYYCYPTIIQMLSNNYIVVIQKSYFSYSTIILIMLFNKFLLNTAFNDASDFI